MVKADVLADEILDKALELAVDDSWQKVRLQDVATSLGISLNQIRQHYRQKDDLAEALFDRADQAVLNSADSGEFKSLCGRERVGRAIFTWLSTLTPYRRVIIDILKYKLEPGHLHLQVLGVLRISRTVQWILEAAGSKTSGISRILEETGTTGVYVTAFSYWLRDRSEGSVKTGDLINRLLLKSESLALLVNSGSVVTKTASQLE